MILTLTAENNSFADQDLIGDMLMRQYKLTQAHGDKLCLAVKKSQSNRPETRAHSPKKASLINKKSEKILKGTGRVYDGNFGDRLCPKKIVSTNLDDKNTNTNKDQKYRTEGQRQEALKQRQDENTKLTNFIGNALKGKLSIADENHFRINNKKSIEICKKNLGDRSKKRVFEDL